MCGLTGHTKRKCTQPVSTNPAVPILFHVFNHDFITYLCCLNVREEVDTEQGLQGMHQEVEELQMLEVGEHQMPEVEGLQMSEVEELMLEQTIEGPGL